MVLILARLTAKRRLRPAVVLRDVSALRAGLRGMVRRYNLQDSARPGQLVPQHSPEGVPALVKDGLVQTCFLTNVMAWVFDSALGRGAHVPHP